MKNSKKDSLKKQLQKGSLKKNVPNTKEIEEITKQVYQEKTPSSKTEKEPSQRTTIDIPKSIHLAAKMESMKDGMSLKEFILNLVRAELDKRGSL